MARNRFTLIHASLLSITLHGFALSIPQQGREPTPPGAIRPSLEVQLLVQASDETLFLAKIEAELAPSIVISDRTASVTPGLVPPSAEVSPEAPSSESIPAEPTFQKVYRGVTMLHQRPIPLVRIELTDLAKRFPGTHATLAVLINETGMVDDVRIREGSHPGLAQYYEREIRELRFVPGKVSGQAVPSELIIDLNFSSHVANANAMPD